MYVSLSELRKLVVDRKAWRAEILGVAESDMTERLSVVCGLLLLRSTGSRVRGFQ